MWATLVSRFFCALVDARAIPDHVDGLGTGAEPTDPVREKSWEVNTPSEAEKELDRALESGLGRKKERNGNRTKLSQSNRSEAPSRISIHENPYQNHSYRI